MSKYEIIRSLKQEIRKVNRIIDHKIIQGLPYHHESRRHKFLISQLNRLTPRGHSWFGRSLHFAGLFMF
jgi:hypothetical protein